MRPGKTTLRVPRWPLVTSVVATLGVLIITSALLLDLRAHIGARARENSENLLRAIERDIARNIEIIDLSLQGVLDGVARQDVMDSDPELRRQVLFDRSGSASGLGAFVVFDANGVVSLDSTSIVPRVIQPVVDRDYFQAQRESDRLFISRPYLSRLIGKPVLGLSRRISNPDGSFGGVALATIEISYFTKLLEGLQLGPRAVVSLLRDDGHIVVRHGSPARGVTNDLSASPIFQRMRAERSGNFVGVSVVDGIERIYTFAQVGDRPLFLSIAQATADVYADWQHRAVLLGFVLAAICTLIVGLTAILTRELRRRAMAEHELAILNVELARLSTTDALTGLGNRRAFDEWLGRELRRSQRTGTTAALVLLDVDHFKRFNDCYGHQQGDRVLAAVAGAIRACCSRPADSAFRVGGEEFAVLLPETRLPGAARVAERIRMAVRALSWPHADSPFGIVTASLGVVEVSDGDAASAFARADTALYASKHGGRDRITASTDQRLAA